MDKDRTSSGVRAEADGASTLDLSGRCVGSSYILVRPLGHGATGTVWRGVDRASGEPVAVKLLHESLLRQPKLVTRFVQERTILLMLRHRNVVRVRDLFSVGESLGLVMDLVPGGSLREYLREHHTLPAGEAARLATQVAAALSEAHELGVVHRDLKPDNILLQTTDGVLETRLTDFGIARVLNTPALTTPNAVVGTPHYMSPEAFHGAPANPAADVYALGVLLYEMVTGRPPYESDNIPDLMRRHLEGRPERRPGIPDALWDVITSCMAQKPRLRPSAAELMAELSDVARKAAGAPALPRPEPAEPAPVIEAEHPSVILPAPRVPQRRNQAPTWRWARPGGLFVVLAGTMLASGVATTAWHLGRSGDGGGQQVAAAVTATATPAPTVTPSAPAATVTPSTRPSRSGAAAGQTVPATGPADDAAAPSRTAATPSRPAPRRSPVPEARPYGPRECVRSFRFDFDDPLLVQTCRSVGSGVQMYAELTASGGARVTARVALEENGRTVAGPYTCRLTYDRGDQSRPCGPHTVAARRGHRYAVVVTWDYDRNGRTHHGRAAGEPFTF